ncbi:TIGR02285 family protein [Kordiimonas sp.]|uniref:TIGR02285 family protein n=1 Tax=Kordiimonas sp. TaxID=1970157 RepID=UPI003A91276F
MSLNSMLHRARLLLTLFLLPLYAFAGAAALEGDEEAERPVIRWYYQNFPPIHIITGQDAGQGFADKALSYLHAQLPGYDHMKVLTSASRIHNEVRTRENACHLGLFKTPEREEYAIFSEPLIEVLPNRIIALNSQRAEFTPFLTEAGEVDLPRLLDEGHFLYGVDSGRYYSSNINKLLAGKTRADGKVELVDPRLGALISRGRVSYSFAFAFEAAYRFRQLGEGDSYFTLPIAGEPEFLQNYVGCNKSAFGEGVVESVNKIAADVRLAHRRFYREWLDEGARADFDAVMARHDARPNAPSSEAETRRGGN